MNRREFIKGLSLAPAALMGMLVVDKTVSPSPDYLRQVDLLQRELLKQAQMAANPLIVITPKDKNLLKDPHIDRWFKHVSEVVSEEVVRGRTYCI